MAFHLHRHLQSGDKQPIESCYCRKKNKKKRLQPSRANCSSPWSLICDRLLKTDRASPGLWIPFPRTLTSSLSGGWSLCEMANGARDIIRQTPGLQSQCPPSPQSSQCCTLAPLAALKSDAGSLNMVLVSMFEMSIFPQVFLDASKEEE